MVLSFQELLSYGYSNDQLLLTPGFSIGLPSLKCECHFSFGVHTENEINYAYMKCIEIYHWCNIPLIYSIRS